MSFNKESIKAFCKDSLTWSIANLKGLVLLGLGIFLLIYTFRIFLYFILFILGSAFTYAGLRELNITSIIGFCDIVAEKMHTLWCKCK